MDASLRPARRFGYSDNVGVGTRPIPRVMRPAMDTIVKFQLKPVESPTEKSVMVEPALPVKPSPGEEETTLSAIEEVVESLVDSEEEDNSAWLSKRTKKTHLTRKWVIAGAALVVMGIGGVFLRPSEAMQPAQVVSAYKESAADKPTPSSPVVSEVPAANYLATYQVGNMQARIITISSIGLETRVIPVGVDGRGQPQLPTHAYDTGWYNVSARPGEDGVVVVSGACSTEAAKGVFEKLSSVNKGDSITVERGDGARIEYSVKEIYRSPVDTLDMTKVLSPFDPKAPGLSLVTCDGPYDSATNDSADRLVVRAIQI